MPLRIEIKGVEVESKRWSKGDRSGEIHEQTGWLDLPSGERRKVKVNVENPRAPYVVGVYTIGDDSFEVDRFGGLMLARIKLVPISLDARVTAVK